MNKRPDLLEAALNDAIEYLKAWPPHPATAAKIRELEKQLSAANEPSINEPSGMKNRALVGSVEWSSSGLPLIRAELVGEDLHLWSGLDFKSVWELHKRLCRKEGLRLAMTELAPDAPRTSLEEQVRQLTRGFDREPPIAPPPETVKLEYEKAQEQLQARIVDFEVNFREILRLSVALAATELGAERGDLAKNDEVLISIQYAIDRVHGILSKGVEDESLQDTLDWLRGELDEIMGAPTQRWQLERFALAEQERT